MRYLMRYDALSPRQHAACSDPEALVYWTEVRWTKVPWTQVRPQIVTTLGSALVGPPQVHRELAAQSLRSSPPEEVPRRRHRSAFVVVARRGGADRGRHLRHPVRPAGCGSEGRSGDRSGRPASVEHVVSAPTPLTRENAPTFQWVD